MTELILVGDLIVMGFMVALVAWLLTARGKERAGAASRIPLEDEDE